MAKRIITSTNSFIKAYKKFVSKKPHLKLAIDKSISMLEEDCYSPLLSTHKLTGKLIGTLACSCGYDCRILFTIEKDTKSNKEVILLIDIGTHNEVY